MSDDDQEPEASIKAKWSEAIGQAILLAAVAWTLFILIQAPWYMQTFNVRPYGFKWFSVTFVSGVVPTLLALLVAFLLCWLIGALRRRADARRAYRYALIIASGFMLLVNFGIWFGQSQ